MFDYFGVAHTSANRLRLKNGEEMIERSAVIVSLVRLDPFSSGTSASSERTPCATFFKKI
jgi:hypothetical protein